MSISDIILIFHQFLNAHIGAIISKDVEVDSVELLGSHGPQNEDHFPLFAYQQITIGSPQMILPKLPPKKFQ